MHHHLHRLFRLAVLLCCIFSISSAQSKNEDDLNVLRDPASRKMLPEALKAIAFGYLAEREKMVAALKTEEEIRTRQSMIRQIILFGIGGLPAQAPLNPKIAGVLKRNGYRIEKVIFESAPAFYVTANLYIPETGRGPFPGILFPLGHESGGKSNTDWQHLAITFARNGFVVLTWDPMGQGERIQIYDPDFGGSKLGQSTTEHTVAGTQCLLLGHSFARHRIHDGLRALDYLVSRPEVDATRIGCTGNSGGGTMTAYLSALDDRIKVAAPSCYITSWRSLLETIGPQDAEQNLPSFLTGLDQADFVAAFAPKPYLILSAIRDFFPIAGARHTFGEVKRLYGVMGASDKLNMFEADDEHGYTLPRRLAAYRWMNRWLKSIDAPIEEAPMEFETEADLFCTETGQVATSLSGETIFSINRSEATQIRPKRKMPTTTIELMGYQNEVQSKVRQKLRFRRVVGDLQLKSYGEIKRDGYRIEKLSMESARGIVVPALLFLPEIVKGEVRPVLYLHENGKAMEAAPTGEIESIVRTGAAVLAIDMCGTGETREELDRSDAFFQYFGAFESGMTAMLIGNSLVGMRALDVVRAVDFLESRIEMNLDRLTAIGIGEAAPVLLHAAVLDERIKGIVLKNMLISYESVLTEKISKRVFENVVPGVLAHYDLPDLAAAMAPRAVTILNPVNPRGQWLPLATAESQYAVAKAAFQSANAGASFVIREQKPMQAILNFLPQDFPKLKN